MSGPPSTCIIQPLAPSIDISDRGEFLAILTTSSGFEVVPLPTIIVALPGLPIIVRRSIKSRFIFPTLASVVTRPSINSSIHSDPIFQSDSRCLACHASLSRLTRMHRSEFLSNAGRAFSAIADRRGCSAKGIPTILMTRLPVSEDRAASSAAAPEPVPPPKAVRMITSSLFVSISWMLATPSLSLCAAKFGRAAVPFALPDASRWRQWASNSEEKEVSSASTSNSSESCKHLACAREDQLQPIPPTPTISMDPGSM